MSEYDKGLYELAMQRGWPSPLTNDFPAETWNNYWRRMEQAEQEKQAGNHDPGRPLPPHRTGR